MGLLFVLFIQKTSKYHTGYLKTTNKTDNNKHRTLYQQLGIGCKYLSVDNLPWIKLTHAKLFADWYLSEWVNSGLKSQQRWGHIEMGPRLKVSYERWEKKGIDHVIPGLIVKIVIHYTTATPQTGVTPCDCLLISVAFVVVSPVGYLWVTSEYWDRKAWPNSVAPGQTAKGTVWSWFTLFAIPFAS